MSVATLIVAVLGPLIGSSGGPEWMQCRGDKRTAALVYRLSEGAQGVVTGEVFYSYRDGDVDIVWGWQRRIGEVLFSKSVTTEYPFSRPTAALVTGNKVVYIAGRSRKGVVTIHKWIFGQPRSGKWHDPKRGEGDYYFSPPPRVWDAEVYRSSEPERGEVNMMLENRADPDDVIVQFLGSRDVYQLATKQVVFSGKDPRLQKAFDSYYSKDHPTKGHLYFMVALREPTPSITVLEDTDRDGTLDRVQELLGDDMLELGY